MRIPGGPASRGVTYVAASAAVFVAVLMALPEPAPPDPADGGMPEVSFAIAGVTVFDGEAFRPDQDVWVESGRIREVGDALDLPETLARVDGGGRTLVPGLIDGHVHTFGSTLNDTLRFGVTTVLDQATHPLFAASKRPARAALARGSEADLFSAGMAATAGGGHGTQFGMELETLGGPAEAPAWVRSRKAEGSDWIKVIYEDGRVYGLDIASLGGDTVGALIAAAHAEGLRAVVHVSALEHALEVVSLGADGLVHVWHDELVGELQAARIAEAGVFVVPTLSVVAGGGGGLLQQELLEAAGDPLVSPMQRQTLVSRFPGDSGARADAGRDVAIENVRLLHAAGVDLIAGTDAPNPGTAAGLSMHGELRLLMRAGLSSAEALAAATSTPAAIFGLDDRGRIAAGRIADLVLIDGDLQADLLSSIRIVAIWKDGYRVDRRVEAATPEASPAPAGTTLIADFEDGIGAAFGAGWQVTTDGMRGGSSSARLSAEAGALRVAGEVVADTLFPWAGAIYFPGDQPMQPVDFSDREVLRFRTRGDGRTYAVELFGAVAGAGAPPTVRFTAPSEWTAVEIPLARFPAADPEVISGLAFVAEAPAGAFAFEIDDVEIR